MAAASLESVSSKSPYGDQGLWKGPRYSRGVKERLTNLHKLDILWFNELIVRLDGPFALAIDQRYVRKLAGSTAAKLTMCMTWIAQN